MAGENPPGYGMPGGSPAVPLWLAPPVTAGQPVAVWMLSCAEGTLGAVPASTDVVRAGDQPVSNATENTASGGTNRYANDAPGSSAVWIKFAMGATAASTYVEKSTVGTGLVNYGRAVGYWSTAALAAIAARFDMVQPRDTATRFRVSINPGGTVSFLIGSTPVATTTVTWPADVEARLEWTTTIDPTFGVVELRLYADPYTSTPLETVVVTGLNTGSTEVTNVRVGSPFAVANVGPFWLRALGFGNVSWFGPLDVPALVDVNDSDTAAATDAASLVVDLAASDTASAVDAVSVLDTGATAKSDGDTASSTDAVTALAVVLTAADTATGADAVTVSARAATSTDTAAGTDTAGTLAAAVSSTDTSSGTDAAAATSRTGPSDTAAGVDAASVLAVAVSSADTATAADVVTVFDPGTTPKSDTDTGTATDAAGDLARTAAGDSSTGTDAGTALARTGIADTASGVDAAALAVAVTATEAAGATDAAGTLAAALSGAETASGADAGAALARTVTETGTGTDAASLAVVLTAADTGTAADAVQTLDTGGPLALNAADTATALEGVSALTRTAAGESSAGADSPAALARTGPADTAAAVDAAALAVSLTAGDTAAGVDLVAGTLAKTAADLATSTELVAALVVFLAAADTGTTSDAATVNTGVREYGELTATARSSSTVTAADRSVAGVAAASRSTPDVTGGTARNLSTLAAAERAAPTLTGV